LQTEVRLTFPIGLTNFADDYRDSQLQPAEVRSHQTQLEKFFSQQIRITNSSNIQGTVEVKPSEKLASWLSLISGLLVAFLGLNFLVERSKTRFVVRTEFLKNIRTKIFNNN